MDYEKVEIQIVESYFLPDGSLGYCKEAAKKMATQLMWYYVYMRDWGRFLVEIL